MAEFLGVCPNCEYRLTVNADKLEALRDNEYNLLKFIRSLPPFSETYMKIIKHEEQLRIEIERLNEKIIL